MIRGGWGRGGWGGGAGEEGGGCKVKGGVEGFPLNTPPADNTRT